MYINAIANNHHDWVESMGWHNKTDLEYLALIAKEIGSAMEECRGDKPTDKLGAELSDIILRTLDFAKEHNINMSDEIYKKLQSNKLRGTLGRVK